MITFGGFFDPPSGPGTIFDDVWHFTGATGLGDPQQWTPILPAGSSPLPRGGQAAGFAASCGRMLVALGRNDSVSPALFNDAWSLGPEAETSFDLYLRGSGPSANPDILFLDRAAPIGAGARFRDSSGLHLKGGNPWQELGRWPAAPSTARGRLTDLRDLHVWLGLKNSDDQGTHFDLRAELYKDGILVAWGEADCVQGVTRDSSKAKEVSVAFSPFAAVDFNGENEGLSLRVASRIGTDGGGGFCGGHANAVGVRLYFDATQSLSRFGTILTP